MSRQGWDCTTKCVNDGCSLVHGPAIYTHFGTVSKGLLLLIAYGNTLRRDDGAGLALAEALVEQWQNEGPAVRHLALQQLTPEVALEISMPDVARVLFVDTAIVDKGNVNKEPFLLRPLTPDQSGRVVGHHFTPEGLLVYAKRLYNHCPPAWLLTVYGSDFGIGEGFSEATANYLQQASTIAQEVLIQLGR